MSAEQGVKAPPTPGWHALGVDAALAALEAREEGLTRAEAAARLEKYGPNRLPTARRRGPLRRFLAQFHDLLIYVLLAAGALAMLLGHEVDAIVIAAVVVVNAAIGFVQEGKAEDALAAIRGMIDPRAAALRDGHRVAIAADSLVPGDVVLLEAGDRVPADLRLLRARNLKMEEAALTGESVAVDKGTRPVSPDAALGDRRSMAYSGTFVAAGQGAGVVVATAQATELGRISALLSAMTPQKTPLIQQMDRFARQITYVTVALAAAAFVIAVTMRGYELGAAVMLMVGLGVAAIPEGLPAIMTITLAIGVQRMARRSAIIRRLPAVETLGAVSVIASDKTGTLTCNEMTARSVVVGGVEYAVSGAGYRPEGALSAAGVELTGPAPEPLRSAIMAGLLCNDAEIREGEQGWVVEGDPMEGALVALAAKVGIEPQSTRRDCPQIDTVPFDAKHRYMASLHRVGEERVIYIKGSPERVIEMCAVEQHAEGERPIDAAAWHARSDAMAALGQRVLGFARKRAAPALDSLTPAEVEQGAAFLGLVGFLDPPREEAIAAVRECAAAGVRVVMITGDHAVTAREIARQLGLAAEPSVLTGHALDSMDAAALAAALRETAVFARTTPEHKLRLVEGLQAAGLTVAMTGDGVNDAPALRRANIGVAMGQKGTEVAKEAADMVLADDNFASIVAAVREGRTVYDNVMKVIAWTLPTNGGEAMTILAALAFGLPLPITPVQILWVNMITAVALGLTLAFEPTEPETMRRRPRPASAPILTRLLLWRIACVSLLFVGGAFGVFFWAEARGLPIEAARTLVVNTIVVMEIFYLFSVRYVHGSALTWRAMMGTRAVLIGVAAVTVGQFALTYTPWMQSIFHTRSVSIVEGMVVVGVGVALLLVVEAEKWLRSRIFA